MNYSIEYVKPEHEHMPGVEVPPVADIATMNTQAVIGDLIDNLIATPEGVRQWHTMIDPLNAQPAACAYEYSERRSKLTNGAMLLIAYTLGYDGTTDVRNFFRQRGVYENSYVPLKILGPIKEVRALDFPKILSDEFQQAAQGEIARESIPDLHYAAELTLDNSQLPFLEYIHPYSRDTLAAYANGEPTTSNAAMRRAAYNGLEAVMRSVEKLEEPTVEELMLGLTSAQHVLASQHFDWKGTIFQTKSNFPDLLNEDYTFKQLNPVDVVSIFQERQYALQNVGFATVDKLALKPWEIDAAVMPELEKSITRIFDMLLDPNGLSSKLSRAQFRGIVHESMWLIDGVMLSTVFDIGNLGFARAITREDRNYMVNKPERKRSFDIRLLRMGRQATNEIIQLKSSETSAKRGTYEDGITVLIEQNFNDAHPRRLAKKRSAYSRILQGQITGRPAKELATELALKSVVQTLYQNS